MNLPVPVYKDDVYCSVQNKIKCLFNTVVISGSSSKRSGQNFNVLASDVIKHDVYRSIATSHVSEKVDGTCCYIQEYEGALCLWARLDRKLERDASKRFKDFCRLKKKWQESEIETSPPQFSLKYPDDLKAVPPAWIPADGVERHPVNEHVLPDANGHIPGWVPISCNPNQYRWHHSVVCDEHQLILVLKEDELGKALQLSIEPIAKYCGKTLELIGTNVNANPYGLGSKQQPFHVLVPHGCLSAVDPPVELNLSQFKNWFENKDVDSFGGNVEGLVWHCANGTMFKLHRHHLGLPWPVRREKTDDNDEEWNGRPWLCHRVVNVRSCATEVQKDFTKLFDIVNRLNSKTFPSLFDLVAELS